MSSILRHLSAMNWGQSLEPQFTIKYY